MLTAAVGPSLTSDVKWDSMTHVTTTAAIVSLMFELSLVVFKQIRLTGPYPEDGWREIVRVASGTGNFNVEFGDGNEQDRWASMTLTGYGVEMTEECKAFTRRLGQFLALPATDLVNDWRESLRFMLENFGFIAAVRSTQP